MSNQEGSVLSEGAKELSAKLNNSNSEPQRVYVENLFPPGSGKTARIQEILTRVSDQEEQYRANVGVDLFSGKGSFNLLVGRPGEGIEASEQLLMQDGSGNVRWVSVEKLSEEEVLEDSLPDRFPDWDRVVDDTDSPQLTKKGSEEESVSTVRKPPVLFFGGGASFNVERPESSLTPPKFATFLVLLLPESYRHVILGDFAEHYRKLKREEGTLPAWISTFVHLFISIWPLRKQLDLRAIAGDLMRRFTK